ncbi:MAG: 23S rRNA (pseudouridine(1915)-N(3))-methyltransferase RlmH [Flavobacteriales bacterium]|nr:23S rRNA (pseudouridine(1915)-N(3))-methyltransferase RlmH [Flavobacteriales bacterium]
MRIRIIMVGRTGRGPARELMEEYLGRLERMASAELVVVPEAGTGDAAHQQRVEQQRLLEAIKPGERVIVLDERGQELSSPEFAQRLGAWRDQGVRQVAFVIGGAYGHAETMRAEADLVLALSRMTFPHQFVRAILAEQLYRAFAILNRLPYHH